MHVDEAGQNIHALAIQFFTTRFEFWPSVGLNFNTRKSYIDNSFNAVLFYHNIHWADRWCTGSVNEGDSSYNELCVRTITLFNLRGFLNLCCYTISDEQK